MKEELYKLKHMRDVLERWKIGGLNRKLQLKPSKWKTEEDEDGKSVEYCVQLNLILKWGGNLTKYVSFNYLFGWNEVHLSLFY